VPNKEVRVRFAPSPTGDLHVGNIRTALFDWAYARHTGGKFIFRIEDTDRERVTDEYINAAIETLKWLGLNWDEGPEVGGPNGPYLQSQRLDIYRKYSDQFIEDGFAYHCYCSAEELEAEREKQKAANVAPGYSGKCRNISPEDLARYKSEGRKPVVRMRMPDGITTFKDAIRGEVTFDHKFVPDFVLVRADGSPLYTLAVAVDDVLMNVTHILRGEDLLSSTPRQFQVYRAMGKVEADFPVMAHLPFVMGTDNAKLSKRNGEVSIAWYRERGFLPEAICNYLALLGWSPGDDVENITMDQLVELFTVERVHSSPARFDMKKLEAINGDKIRLLTVDDLTDRIVPFLKRDNVITGSAQEIEVVKSAVPIIQERIATLAEASAMLKFLFVKNFEVDAQEAPKLKEAQAQDVLKKTLEVLEPLTNWNHIEIEAVLRSALLDGLGLKPRIAFGSVRVAVTGSHISPPLFESMALLGKERSITRLKQGIL
jgi:glutamyl-tRNA synthetase